MEVLIASVFSVKWKTRFLVGGKVEDEMWEI